MKLLQCDIKVLFVLNLNELLLQLVDGQTLPLLQDGELRLLPIGGLVAPKRVLLPLWDVVRHHADASHVSCDLPPISWNRGDSLAWY